MDNRLIIPPWGIADILVGLFGVLSGTILIKVFLLNNTLIPDNPDALTITIAIFISETMLILVVIGLTLFKYKCSWIFLGLTRTLHISHYWLALAVLGGSFFSNGLYFFIVSTADWETLIPTGIPAIIVGKGVYRIFNSFILGIWGPFAEEIFFRGFILSGLTTRFGVTFALITSSLIFSLSHITLSIIVPVFISGILLGFLYIKTRSIWPCIAVHSIQNLIALTFFGS